MVTQGRRENSALIERLFEEGYCFDFFQAVRLLGHYRHRLNAMEQSDAVGTEESGAEESRNGVSPQRGNSGEAVRFRGATTLRFPAGAVHRLDRPKETGEDELPQMFVSMMGLTGPNGVLPTHYTELIVERIRNGDHALREFLDLFLHRIVALFYDAWGKYRVTIGSERALVSDQSEDLFAKCVASLVGLGTEGQREQLGDEDRAVLSYAAHYSDSARPAVNLQDVLSDYLGIPVEVEQFQGHWLYLNEDDRSRLACAVHPEGAHAVLGVDFVIGGRVWDVQGKFRLRLGPLDYEQFCRLLPGEEDCRRLSEMTRLYVSPDLDFDIQPILKNAEIPPFCLTTDDLHAPRLGWNTWAAAERFEDDAENVIFALDSI